MSDDADQIDATRTDDGVPVGDADVQADIDRASGARGNEPERDEFLQEGAVEGSTDRGVPVGVADAEEDRRRANVAGDPGESEG
jgi:hypothetical protein